MNIFFRADANKSIGMGHIMRCLSIADALSGSGNNATFIISDNNVSSLIQERGYKAIVLNSLYNQMDEEIKLWPQNIKPDILFVDSYFVTERYLFHLRENIGLHGGKLIYLDDVLSFPYPVDVLINYNAYANKEAYDMLYADADCKIPELIIGPQYVPLRPMFRDISHRIQNNKVENVLISTGGSDELHLSISLIDWIQENVANDDLIYHFLIGAMNEDRESIRLILDDMNKEGCVRIMVHEDVPDMSSLIRKMDIVVSAAGSTLYEIAACGVPLITYSLADNQIPGGEAFSSLGMGIYIGDLRDPETVDYNKVMSGELREDAIESIMDAIEELRDDYNQRVAMGSKMQNLIDGCGAERLCSSILTLKNDKETM